MNTKAEFDNNGFVTISAKILYFGTPVALITFINEDGSPNLGPVFSFWALGWTMSLVCCPTQKRWKISNTP